METSLLKLLWKVSFESKFSRVHDALSKVYYKCMAESTCKKN